MSLWWGLVAIVVLLAMYVSWTSTRLDRLHSRVDAARAALDAQLVRRSAVTLELAASGLLDPASSLLLAGAAHRARAAAPEQREAAESELTSALLAAVQDVDLQALLQTEPSGRSLLAELEATTAKVALARRFHNDAVRATIAVRRKAVVRVLRLAGHAPSPTFFEMDDTAIAAAELI